MLNRTADKVKPFQDRKVKPASMSSNDNSYSKSKEHRSHDRRGGDGHHSRSKVKSHSHHYHQSSSTSSSFSSHRSTSNTQDAYSQKRSNEDHDYRHKCDSKRRKYDERSRSGSRSHDNDKHRYKSTSRSPQRRSKDEKDKDRHHRHRAHHSSKSSGDNDRSHQSPSYKSASKERASAAVPKVISGDAVTQHQTVASKLMERVQQRKQLFNSKAVDIPNATGTASSLWKQSTFSGDQDGKMSAKFRRLMGMKGDLAETSMVEDSGDTLKNQQKHLADLEKQYEVARRVTHAQKGLGLGFGSFLP